MASCRPNTNGNPSGDGQPGPNTIALVGNPNVGKSVIFSLLTGKYVVVSNYPGTTVEVSTGAARLGGRPVEIVDTPGVNSLIPRSEDEEVARAILLDRAPRAVLQVADGKNLRRGLLITVQLAEMGLPTALALNMWDEAMDRGISVDAGRLSQMLGVPVVKTVATHKRGIGKLAASVSAAVPPVARIDYGPAIEEAVARIEPLLPELHFSERAAALMLIAGDPGLEARLGNASGAAPESGRPERGGRRRRGGRGGGYHRPGARSGTGQVSREPIAAIREEVRKKFSEPLSYVISKKRAEYVDGILEDVMSVDRPRESTRSSRAAFFYFLGPALSLIVCYLAASIVVAAVDKFAGLDAKAVPARWALAVLGAGFYVAYLFRNKKHTNSISSLISRLLMHPVLAFPVLAAVLWVVYKLVGEFGAGLCVDFIETNIFGDTIEPAGGFSVLGLHVPFAGINYYLAQLAEQIVSRDNFVYQLLLGERAGLVRVGLTDAIAILLPIVSFFFFAFALMEDSGYLPRLAVMADWLFKKIGLNGKALLPIVLGLGCGTMATLTTRILHTRRERVIATFVLALAIPCSAQLGVISGLLSDIGGGGAFALYVAVIAGQFFFAGYVASKVLKGKKSEFLLEVPPLRMPRLQNVIAKTFFRVAWFMKEAVPLFLLGTLVLFILTRVGYNENTRPLGLLSYVERAGAPVTHYWLGLPEGGGPAAVAPDAQPGATPSVSSAGAPCNSATEAFIMAFLRRDYAAVSIRENFKSGFYSGRQALVALVVVTLFVPCLASTLMIIKERGALTAAMIVGFIFPYAFFVGGLMNRLLLLFNCEF